MLASKVGKRGSNHVGLGIQKGHVYGCERYGGNPNVRNFHRCNVMRSLPDHTQRLFQGLSCLPRHRAALDCQMVGQVLNCSLKRARHLVSGMVEIPGSGSFTVET